MDDGGGGAGTKSRLDPFALGGLSGIKFPGTAQGPDGLQSGISVNSSPITPAPAPLNLIPGFLMEPSFGLTKFAPPLPGS